MLLSQAYLSVVDLESRSGQDTGLDLAQGLADLVHGLVHYHDGGTCCSFQPAVLAVGAAQHAIYQSPAPLPSPHSFVYLFMCCISVIPQCTYICNDAEYVFCLGWQCFVVSRLQEGCATAGFLPTSIVCDNKSTICIELSNRQTSRQVGRQTDRQAGRQAGRPSD